jgi:hypothetical protein
VVGAGGARCGGVYGGGSLIQRRVCCGGFWEDVVGVVRVSLLVVFMAWDSHSLIAYQVGGWGYVGLWAEVVPYQFVYMWYVSGIDTLILLV